MSHAARSGSVRRPYLLAHGSTAGSKELAVAASAPHANTRVLHTNATLKSSATLICYILKSLLRLLHVDTPALCKLNIQIF